MSMLHFAALHGNRETVAALLERHADPCSLDSSNFLPLQRAIHHGHWEVCDQLLSAMEGWSVPESVEAGEILAVAAGLLVDLQQSTLARRLVTWWRPGGLFGLWSEWGWTATVRRVWDGHSRAEFYPVIDPAVEYPVDELVALIGQLRGKGNELEAAAAALGKLGKVGALAAISLARCSARNTEENARKAAAEALGKIGEHAGSAVSELTKYLEDKTELPASGYAAYKGKKMYVRTAAAEALGNLGKHGAAAVPQLTKCLEDENPMVRSAAAGALGKLGEHGAAAVPQLTKYLEHKKADVRSVLSELAQRFCGSTAHVRFLVP